ncbi:MAG: hypothetical protein VKO65_01870 [Cyanobacteriota bacterium]|nr:hypothetical protein [Cyanobacteriota bacterium]
MTFTAYLEDLRALVTLLHRRAPQCSCDEAARLERIIASRATE